MFNFSFKNIIYFFFYFSYKLLIKSQTCNDFIDCNKCVLCGDDSSTSCECVYTNTGCSVSNIGGYSIDENWYSKVTTCINLDEANGIYNEYCPSLWSKVTQDDLDEDKSVTFEIRKDFEGYYGRNLIVCNFYYEQVEEQDIIINVEYPNNINKLPKVYMESTDVTSVKTRASVESNREISFSSSVKINIIVLLRNDYTISPIKIKLSLDTNNKGKIIAIVLIVIIIGITLGCIIFCLYRMYKNNEARRRARLYLYGQARENMARIEQENYNYYNNENYSQEESVDLEKINKEKLDQLFNGKMAQHLYKKEYNQYGGGCSICLTEFKKKSKVSITSCKHVFHYKCIYDWLYKNIRNPKCPNCNHEILNDDEDNNTNKEKGTRIIKVKKKPPQTNNSNNNNNQQMGAGRGIVLNNGSNIEASQSQRHQLGDY